MRAGNDPVDRIAPRVSAKCASLGAAGSLPDEEPALRRQKESAPRPEGEIAHPEHLCALAAPHRVDGQPADLVLHRNRELPAWPQGDGADRLGRSADAAGPSPVERVVHLGACNALEIGHAGRSTPHALRAGHVDRSAACREAPEGDRQAERTDEARAPRGRRADREFARARQREWMEGHRCGPSQFACRPRMSL